MTVQRTFSQGVKAGLLTGLGSSVADCFYVCVGVFGLTIISGFLLRYQGSIFAFSYFGISGDAGVWEGFCLVCGVFLGTYLCWGALSAATGMIKKKTAHFSFRYMNRIFGSILCLFGAVVFIRLAL